MTSTNGDSHHRQPQPGPPPGAMPPGQVPLHMLPLPQIQQQWQEQVEKNKAAFTELARQGIQLNPLELVHGRIDMLIDAIAQFAGPDGPRWAMLTRLQFEQQVAQNLVNARSQGTMAQLASGASFTPGMIAEMARQSGMFGKKKS